MLEFKKRTLLVCPTCESRGIKSVLGELGTSGELIVQRFHQNYTIINSPLMSVSCSSCGEVAYTKDERNISPQGVGIHWESIAFSLVQGTLGTLIA